jgi:hypothetical protein
MADSDIIVSLHLVIPFISMGCSKQDSKLAITKTYFCMTQLQKFRPRLITLAKEDFNAER